MKHPTALIDPTADLSADVSVGAFAVIEGGVKIGAGCQIAAHAVVKRGTTLEEKVFVDHHAVIGGLPQDLTFNPSTTTYVKIGARTVIREHVTIHRATHAERATVIGPDCMLMASSHVAHDCTVGHHVIIANGAMLAGHLQVGDYAFISGGVAIHQFCRVGSGALISGNAVITADVAPCTLSHSRNAIAGLNLIGLRRRKVSPEAIIELKQAYHLVFQEGADCQAQADQALANGKFVTPEGLDFLKFFQGGKRGQFVYPE